MNRGRTEDVASAHEAGHLLIHSASRQKVIDNNEANAVMQHLTLPPTLEHCECPSRIGHYIITCAWGSNLRRTTRPLT